MSAVQSNILAPFPGASLATSARGSSTAPAPGDAGGWQTAMDTAGSAQGDAQRLLELNTVMPTPAARLSVLDFPQMGASALPAASATHIVLRAPSPGGAANGATAPAHGQVPAPGIGEAGLAPADPVDAATAQGSTSSVAQRVSRPASDAPAAAPGDETLCALPIAHASFQETPHRAVAAYASASAASASGDASPAVSFSVASRATITPVRVHVQWRGRVADVWIGLHRSTFDRLDDVRRGVEDWVSARGGVVGQVVCNGETLAGTSNPIHFPGAF